MTQLTIFRSPGDLVVVARAAKLSIYDIRHEHVIGARTHLEADLGVAYRAVEADAMEPVREDHWTHACFFRPLIEYHITEFSMGGGRKQSEQDYYACHPYQVPNKAMPVTGENQAFHISVHINVLGRVLLLAGAAHCGSACIQSGEMPLRHGIYRNIRPSKYRTC